MKKRLILIMLPFFSLCVNAYIPDVVETSSGQQLATGNILIASKSITDGIFNKTVILLTHYDQDGAAGLIINRPSKSSLKEAIPDLVYDDKTRLLFIGGPVQRAVLSVLIKTKNDRKDLTRVVGNIYHGLGSRRLIDNTGQYFSSDSEDIRFYSGYAGWGKGQLEAEIKGGGWHTIDVNPEHLFDMDFDSMWEVLIQKVQ